MMIRLIGPRTQRPLLVLVLGLATFAALTTPVLAAEAADEASDERPPTSLRLSPAVLEVPHEAGPAEHELRIDNLGSESTRVVTDLNEFTVARDGATQFAGPDEISASSWAELDVDEFELEPGGQRNVTLTVEVPDDAEPGERYLSAIFAVPGDPDAEGNITVTNRVAAKLYIEVPGDRVEHIELGQLSGPRLIDTGSATFELPVHNRGNVHRRFQEDTQLMATSGDAEFGFENFTVIGDATRVVEATWPDPPMLCWCTVEVEIADGQGNLATASTQVIAFPLRLTLALLALTAGVVVLAFANRRRRVARFEQQHKQARPEGVATPAPPRQPLAPTPPAPVVPSVPSAPPSEPTVPPPPAASVTDDRDRRRSATTLDPFARRSPDRGS